MKKLMIILSFPVMLFACQNQTANRASADRSTANRVEADRAVQERELRAQSDSLTNAAQLLLVKNLTEAIQKGGVAYAIDFCNLEAISLTKLVVAEAHASLQRITDGNRNPDNALQTQMDEDVFTDFKSKENLRDTLLLSDENHHIYYKRIHLAMPTCMNCHGGTDQISAGTLARIDHHYPKDKAKDYELNEFRGLWKLTYRQ